MKVKQAPKRKPADLRLVLDPNTAETLRARAESERRTIQTQAILEIEWSLTHRPSESPV